MRLIHAKTLKLEEFHHKPPPYAILSHTWGDKEVTLQEYRAATEPYHTCNAYGADTDNGEIKRKAGFAKIENACRRAHADGLEYLWCDTNCIDKTSSAELTEAINSMYAWYRDSAVCYAYLADVGAFDRVGRGAEEIRKSRWFTRGWTLQELLAPDEVLFFNSSWALIADRKLFAEIIHGATRIHVGALLNRNTIPDYSIAQRMSWAAHRQTTRHEDVAYCLLGIFGVNMPLLYGEGSKAFTRLQEEIIKASNDHSIFAWDFFDGERPECNGMLASSPRNFSSCDSIVRNKSIARRPYSITNLGVSLQLPMIQSVIDNSVLVGLNCAVELHKYRPRKAPRTGNVRFPVWIWLTYTGENNIYGRSSVPASRIFLPVFYPDIVNCVVTNLFGITNQPSWFRSQALPSSSSGHSIGPPTGFHVIIGFGRMDRETTILEDSFPPRHYAVFRLPPRPSSALSHEIISAGNHVVLLSIAWDHHHQQPLHWDHDIFIGGLGSVRHWSTNNWDILFRTQPRSNPVVSDPFGQINYIHNQLRKDRLYRPMSDMEKNVAPIIYFDKDIMQDQHDQARIVAHLTFQQLGKRRPGASQTDSD